ncbi:MAG: DsbA family protein [Caulobacteraceae bacterium]|nr:DsbA family protein [Caulobacter sp.]
MRSLTRRLAVAACAALALSACGQKGGSAAAGGVGGAAPAGAFKDAEYVIGDPKAPVTVIEYLSDTCSHCARFDREVFPTIKKDYIDPGKVSWHIREFLTDPVQVSAAGFALARCAGKDKYWSVVEAIFRAQDEMFRTGDFLTPFKRIAAGVGMSPAQFDACVRNDQVLQGIADRVQRATDVDKITGTPTIIVDGDRHVNEMDLPQTRAALDKALAAKGKS